MAASTAGRSEFHINVPVEPRTDGDGARLLRRRADRSFNASSLFSASDGDGDSLLYFFYDNSAEPDERPLHGQRRGAGRQHDLRGDGGAAGVRPPSRRGGCSDDLFVNAWDGAAYSGPKEFHVNVPANHAPTVTAPDFSASSGQVVDASDAVHGERCRRRHPAVLLLRQQRGSDERPLHRQRRGAGRRHDLRGLGRRSWRRPPSRPGPRARTICS